MEQYPLIVTILLQAIIILLCIGLIYYLFTSYRIYHSKQHLESAFDSIEDPLAVVDTSYVLRRVNKPYISLVGQNYQKVLGKKCYTILRGRSSPCEECRLVGVLTTGTKLFVPQCPHPQHGGTAKISLSFYPFTSKKNYVPCIIEHIRDITELESLKNNLEQEFTLLSDTTTVLRRAHKEIHEELNVARQIQQRIMPQRAPQVPGIKITHTYHPIEEVGGDVYDFISVNPHQLGFFIGDVSGHGLSSAFVSTISKILLYQQSKKTMPTDHLLGSINQDLIGNVGRSHYLTCFWGIFDTRDNSFTFSRAGHPMPIVLRANGDIIQLTAQGTFLGVLDNPAIEPKKFFFRKGDRCILFTDGIYEVKEIIDQKMVVFSYKQFQEIAAQTKDLPLEEVIPYIKKQFASFTHEDDYTLIAFDITEDRPQDLSEELPGIHPEDDIAYYTFTTMTEIDYYFKSLAKQMRKAAYSEELIKQAEYSTMKLIAIVIESYEQEIPENDVTVAHTFRTDELRICVKGKNTIFSIDEPFGENILKNSKGNALSFSLYKS